MKPIIITSEEFLFLIKVMSDNNGIVIFDL